MMLSVYVMHQIHSGDLFIFYEFNNFNNLIFIPLQRTLGIADL